MEPLTVNPGGLTPGTLSFAPAAFQQDQVLQQAVQLIVQTARPEKIFLAGQVLKKTKRIFDLLIIIPDSCPRSFREYETLIGMACPDDPQIDFSLHASGSIHHLLMEGHIFYSSVCIPENLLYDNGEHPLPGSILARIALIREKAKKDFYSRQRRAGSFLQGAGYYYKNGEKEMAAFMLQQATELMLRGVIAALTGVDLHTHCISKLKRYCRRCASSLNELFPADTDREAHLLHLLEQAYTSTRYRDDFIVEQQDLSALFERVRSLHAAAQQAVEEKIILFGLS